MMFILYCLLVLFVIYVIGALSFLFWLLTNANYDEQEHDFELVVLFTVTWPMIAYCIAAEWWASR